MQIARSIAEMKALRSKCAEPVGFVPTMGSLHEGHLELVRIAVRDNPVAVVSIFVNPTQFAPDEDYKAYPRDLDRDLAMLDQVKTGIVFIPDSQDMYADGYNTWVDVNGITGKLEGKARPTHFRGVTTVCNKLFNIVQPHQAYFGQKDAQQAIVIQKMAADLNMNLEVVVCPTIREKDGLAMSSRNTYLTGSERIAAPVLYRSLCLASDMFSNGERDAGVIRKAMIDLISQEAAAKIDYVSVADLQTLSEVDKIEGNALASLAVRLGKPRLIDNIVLD